MTAKLKLPSEVIRRIEEGRDYNRLGYEVLLLKFKKVDV